MISISPENRQPLARLIMPSWASLLLTVLAGLGLSLGVSVIYDIHNSTIQQQLLAWQINKPQPALTQPGQILPETSKPTLQGSWPLMIIWGVVGLIVYWLIAAIAHSVHEAQEVRESLSYVNARPKSIIELAVERVVLRVLALITLIILIDLFIKKVVPYCITADLAGASNAKSLDAGFYALLAFMVAATGVHLQIIFLRLSLGKIRILGE